MSTWTSSRARIPAALLAALLAALALAACLPFAGGGGDRVVALPGPPPFAVAAPAGFCAARGGPRTQGAAQVVAFAPCTGDLPAALLTATVGPPGSAAPGEPDPQALSDFLRSERGRAGLSRAGQAASVTVREVLAADGAVFVRLTDTAPARGPAVEGDGWRAVLAVSGRLVTLSATGGRGAALDRDGGRRLIGAFVAALRRANGTAA